MVVFPLDWSNPGLKSKGADPPDFPMTAPDPVKKTYAPKMRFFGKMTPKKRIWHFYPQNKPPQDFWLAKTDPARLPTPI